MTTRRHCCTRDKKKSERSSLLLSEPFVHFFLSLITSLAAGAELTRGRGGVAVRLSLLRETPPPPGAKLEI